LFEFKSKTEFFVTVKTQQQRINISILLWQHVSASSDHLQTSVQKYEAQSVNIVYSYTRYALIVHCCILTVTLKIFCFTFKYYLTLLTLDRWLC